MAQTFTGLKLEGAHGRFGNTEVSDVIGILAMPDGKVSAYFHLPCAIVTWP